MSLDLINMISTMLLLYLGMFAINLSMERHAKQILQRPLSPIRAKISYALGWLALLLAFFPAIAAWGAPIGITTGFGALTLILALMIFIQSYRPRLNLHLAGFSGVLLCGLQVFR